MIKNMVGNMKEINEPKEIWFDKNEVQAFDIFWNKINLNKVKGRKEDLYEFITLEDISNLGIKGVITVIHETPLSGAIYRYGNYNDNKWWLVGEMYGYA